MNILGRDKEMSHGFVVCGGVVFGEVIGEIVATFAPINTRRIVLGELYRQPNGNAYQKPLIVLILLCHGLYRQHIYYQFV